MPTRLIDGYVDSHCHFFESKRVAQWVKDTCNIWEYGSYPRLEVSSASGTLTDLLQEMSTSNISRSIVVNCFSIDEWRDRVFSKLTEGLNLPTHTAVSRHSPLANLMMGYNEWLLKTVNGIPEVVPFMVVDPWVAPYSELEEHVNWAVINGIKGVKIHPIAQRIDFNDEDAISLVRMIASHDLPLVIHSGKAKGSVPFGEIDSLRGIAKIPGVKLIIAHMGGASWRMAPLMAADYPEVTFDISELIAWLGAPNAPNASDLTSIIRQIGPDRIMFGSDFPWYSQSKMVNVVMNLPGLSSLELSAILRDNAMRHYSID